jgi:tetratricopeptide (TPR) repeat protein
LLLEIFSYLFASAHEDLLDHALMRLRDFSLISDAGGGSEFFLHQMTYVAARCWIEENYTVGLADHINNSFKCMKTVLEDGLKEDETGIETQVLSAHTMSLFGLKDVGESECAGVERQKFLESWTSALAEAFRWPGLQASIACVCELAEREPNTKLRLFSNGVRLSIKYGSALGTAELEDCETGLVDILTKYPELCSGERDWRRVAYLQRSLSGTRFDLGNLEGGLEAIDASLATLRDAQDHSSVEVSRSHGGRGRTLDALGRSDEALAEYEKALACLEQLSHRTFILDRDEVELRYCMGDVLLRLDRSEEARTHMEWAQQRAEKLYPRIDRGSIKNSLGRVLMFQGLMKPGMKWLRQGRYAIGRAYGIKHPAYAKQLIDITTLMTFSAVLADPDLSPSECRLRAPLRLARQALQISQAVPGARQYVFASLICLE